MDSPPFVTVLMPVYNSDSFVKEAIDSILKQTYTHFEFLIINDGSTDATEEIIKSIHDPRIILVNHPHNQGLIAALNNGLDRAKGKYIVRIDGDDISLPQRIEKQVFELERNPEIGVIGSWFEEFGEHIQTKLITYKCDDTDIRIQHLFQDQLAAPTKVFRKSLVDQHKLRFDPLYDSAEDYGFNVEMSMHCKLANLPVMLTRKRDHPQNANNLRPQIMKDNSLLIRQKQFRRMGVELNLDEIKLYGQFAYSVFKFSDVVMKEIWTLLERVLNANEVSGFIPRQAYREYLARHFYHLCYNNPLIGKEGWKYFSKSSFYKIYSPTILEKLKFRFKTLLP
jgi:glycosyltransferase involved in cell wall biosynthesis